MNKEIASDLLLVVNTPDYFNALTAYAEYRIGRLCHQLAILQDFNEIVRVQGQIRELQRLLTLRDEVIQVIKDAKVNGN